MTTGGDFLSGEATIDLRWVRLGWQHAQEQGNDRMTSGRVCISKCQTSLNNFGLSTLLPLPPSLCPSPTSALSPSLTLPSILSPSTTQFSSHPHPQVHLHLHNSIPLFWLYLTSSAPPPPASPNPFSIPTSPEWISPSPRDPPQSPTPVVIIPAASCIVLHILPVLRKSPEQCQ